MSPDILAYIASLIRLHQPQIVVELGSGSSTALLSHLLEQHGDGKVIALEHEERFAELSEELIARLGRPRNAEIVRAPLRHSADLEDAATWYDLTNLDLQGPIDILIIDGPLCTQANLPDIQRTGFSKNSQSKELFCSTTHTGRTKKKQYNDGSTNKSPG